MSTNVTLRSGGGVGSGVGDSGKVTVTQDDVPDKWSCDSSKKTVKVEIRSPIAIGASSFNWVEIPTTSVEQWTEKGNAASIQRTAKVKFPNTWGQDSDTVITNSPRQFIDNYQPDNSSQEPFLHARIWWRNGDSPWTLKHYGWVGGVGSTEDEQVSKMWVYDFAEFLKGVPIDKTFNGPNIPFALQQIAQLTNKNAPIPVSQATVIEPQTEEEFDRALLQFPDVSDGDGLTAELEETEVSNVYEPIYYSLNDNQFSADIVTETDTSTIDLLIDELIEQKLAEENQFSVTDVSEIDNNFNLSRKTFVSNHDSLLDVYDWFEEETNAKLHFEPRPHSVVLVADVEPSRRSFYGDYAAQYAADNDSNDSFHELTSVMENDSLYEMKPFNTVHLRGGERKERREAEQNIISEAIDVGTFGLTENKVSKDYPIVTVQVPSLVQAANGTELSPEMIESNVTDLGQAETEARQKLSELLAEESEGSILLRGTPKIMPYDSLTAFEQCNERVQFESSPVQYEVESVKDVKTADGIYKTKTTVSVWANDSNIETVRAEYVDIQNGDN